MSTPTIRTKAHAYPREEIEAMIKFYGGKRCVITNKVKAIEWCHILDGAIESSNPRVSSLFFQLGQLSQLSGVDRTN